MDCNINDCLDQSYGECLGCRVSVRVLELDRTWTRYYAYDSSACHSGVPQNLCYVHADANTDTEWLYASWTIDENIIDDSSGPHRF
jgi:hypothetical protein